MPWPSDIPVLLEARRFNLVATLVSRSAATSAIGARVNAQMAIQYDPSDIAPAARPLRQLGASRANAADPLAGRAQAAMISPSPRNIHSVKPEAVPDRRAPIPSTRV